MSSFSSFFQQAHLSAIKAQEGAKGVPVGSVIAIVGEEGDDLSGAAGLAEQLKQSASQKPAEPEKAEAPKPPAPSAPEPTPSQEARKELPPSDRIFASPIAKKIALEQGIPLSKVKGSGPNGRILREDVEKYQSTAPAAAAPSPAVQPPAGLPAEYVDTPVSNMRRTIGARLTQSKQEVPHYYLTVDINMDKVSKLREVFNKTLSEKDQSAKLSVNDFIVKAVACALADVPEANSAWLGEVIRTYVSLYPRLSCPHWLMVF